jgi:hypothetical protein
VFLTKEQEPIVENVGTWDYRANGGNFSRIDIYEEWMSKQYKHIYLFTPKRCYSLSKKNLQSEYYAISQTVANYLSMPLAVDDVFFRLLHSRMMLWNSKKFCFKNHIMLRSTQLKTLLQNLIED